MCGTYAKPIYLKIDLIAMYVPLTIYAHNHEDRENSFQVSPTNVQYLNNLGAMDILFKKFKTWKNLNNATERTV